MALFSDGNRNDHSDFGIDVRDGDGALDALIILLLIAFAFGIWFVSGTVRPALYDTNPSLIAHPVPASGPYYSANPVPPPPRGLR
ncbi:hypothetical protein [Hyphomicrobium sp.]|jgi:hypothetical protein|uniref:hypothetical protein n=1 Tax=Hyphomicrobium sp. TaxID=82 RepID=UPI0035672E08